jgi:hypothetical protein
MGFLRVCWSSLLVCLFLFSFVACRLRSTHSIHAGRGPKQLGVIAKFYAFAIPSACTGDRATRELDMSIECLRVVCRTNWCRLVCVFIDFMTSLSIYDTASRVADCHMVTHGTVSQPHGAVEHRRCLRRSSPVWYDAATVLCRGRRRYVWRYRAGKASDVKLEYAGAAPGDSHLYGRAKGAPAAT